MTPRGGQGHNYDPSGNGLQLSIAMKLGELGAEMRFLRETLLEHLHLLPERTVAQMVLHLDKEEGLLSSFEETGSMGKLLKLGRALYKNLSRLSILFGIWSTVIYAGTHTGQAADLVKQAFKLTLQAIFQP